MTHLALVFFAAIFTNNILLTNFLGMCPFLAISKQLRSSLGMGAAVIFVMGTTSLLNWLLYAFVLVPLKLEYLMYIAFIVVIAAFVQLVEMIVERSSPLLYASLGVFLPLITVNCAILGASLFMVIRHYTFIQTVGFGIGSGVGWALAIVTMAGIRERLAKTGKVVAGLEGAGIALIIAGLMSMAFIGFTGMVRLT